MNIAIITGASSGLGREFVTQLDAEGYDCLWVIARRTERLEALAGECKTPVRPISMDLSLPESFDALRALLEAEKPTVSALVAASGFGKYGAATDMTAAEINSMIDVNCKALIFTTLTVLPYMTSGGRILVMGSASAFQPLPYFNLYAATKSFVVHYSRALNVELKDRNISVTAVCPGYVRTEFFDVAKQTGNPDACNNFTPMYEPEDVVRKALKDSKRGKDLSVLGFTTKVRRLCGKLLPTKLVMNSWLKMK